MAVVTLVARPGAADPSQFVVGLRLAETAYELECGVLGYGRLGHRERLRVADRCGPGC